MGSEYTVSPVLHENETQARTRCILSTILASESTSYTPKPSIAVRLGHFTLVSLGNMRIVIGTNVEERSHRDVEAFITLSLSAWIPFDFNKHKIVHN